MRASGIVFDDASSLGAVEIHRELMTAEHSRIIAAKL
jgi:hypothetical protein